MQHDRATALTSSRVSSLDVSVPLSSSFFSKVPCADPTAFAAVSFVVLITIPPSSSLFIFRFSFFLGSRETSCAFSCSSHFVVCCVYLYVSFSRSCVYIPLLQPPFVHICTVMQNKHSFCCTDHDDSCYVTLWRSLQSVQMLRSLRCRQLLLC